MEIFPGGFLAKGFSRASNYAVKESHGTDTRSYDNLPEMTWLLFVEFLDFRRWHGFETHIASAPDIRGLKFFQVDDAKSS